MKRWHFLIVGTGNDGKQARYEGWADAPTLMRAVGMIALRAVELPWYDTAHTFKVEPV